MRISQEAGDRNLFQSKAKKGRFCSYFVFPAYDNKDESLMTDKKAKQWLERNYPNIDDFDTVKEARDYITEKRLVARYAWICINIK